MFLAALIIAMVSGTCVFGEDAPAATLPAATVEDRLADLEAYISNGAPPTGAADFQKTKLAGPISATSGPGHNAWLMTSSALVLFMTLPGLALFYGGLVRRKNVLSVLAQCLGITGLVAILWWAVGYSFVFGKSFGSGILGGSEFFFFQGVDSAPNTDYAYWVSHNVFAMFQMMFAIITPALIVGAVAERMKFSAILLFMTLWMLVVYFPLAHMVWGVTGCMNGVWNADCKIPAIDFAGGTVVHMSSGWSALILCLILGKRVGFGKESFAPHSMVLCMVGTGMLWVGWYGFNAGSAVAADGIAANAFTTTTMATAVASFVWAMAEFLFKGKPSVLGFCSGAVAGLVVITPACGFVNTTGAVVIGIAAGLVPFFAITKLKHMLGYDDALDTFGVHAVGGTLGALLTGFLATEKVNANLVSEGVAKKNHLADLVTSHMLWTAQLKAIVITILLAVIGTLILGYVTRFIVGLRLSEEEERQGLDLIDHNEEGYNH
ncbi:MAG: ammonium transporter [Verrucomicrobiae bacterium]|nr:ammonium transporter [Verrucomicrobiae bacterium]